jgi:S1-C subfamily serine protease
MLKNIFKILAFFIIGMVGGIFAEQIFWPYFVERPLFYKYNLEQQPIYVTERKTVTLRENVALQDAVEKVEKVVVAVKSKTLEGKVLKGGGLVVTADGLIITLAELVPQGSDFYFYVDEKWPSYQILRRKNNLALVKVGEEKLQTCGFADLKKTRLGERVFLVGFDFSTTTPQKVVNQGIIKSFGENSIQTNIFEKATMAGSPLFDIEGKVVGLCTVDEEGQVSAIPITTIRHFIGL